MAFCYERGIPHSTFLQWDPEDKAKVIAFILEKAARCSSCGTAPWEWENNKFAYTAVDELCQGCYQKTVYQDTMGKPLPGTNVKLVPTTPYFKAKMMVSAMKRRKKLKE
jgi:hypothetical protein